MEFPVVTLYVDGVTYDPYLVTDDWPIHPSQIDVQLTVGACWQGERSVDDDDDDGGKDDDDANDDKGGDDETGKSPRLKQKFNKKVKAKWGVLGILPIEDSFYVRVSSRKWITFLSIITAGLFGLEWAILLRGALSLPLTNDWTGLNEGVQLNCPLNW